MKKHLLVRMAVALGPLPMLPAILAAHGGGHGGGPPDFVPPTVFQAAGPTVTSIQGVIDQFRLALGNSNNGNGSGPLTSGRREINWDGGGSAATSVVPTPFTGFLSNRGALLTTPGSGFVQATPAGLSDLFDNPSYDTVFQSFSPLRLFAAIGSNVTDTDFFVPGAGTQRAAVNGFGVIFSDLDQPDGSGPAAKRGNRGASTLLECYGVDGELLFSGFAPASPGDGTFSFLGIEFKDARIAHVRITSGDTAPGRDDDAGHDVVMMDDFLYGEPQAIR